MSLQGGRHTYAAAQGVGHRRHQQHVSSLSLMPYALFRALCLICHLRRCPWRRASQASAARQQQPEPSARLPRPAIYLYPPHPPRAPKRLGRALPTFSVSVCTRLVRVKRVNPTPVAASESQGTRRTRAPAGSLYLLYWYKSTNTDRYKLSTWGRERVGSHVALGRPRGHALAAPQRCHYLYFCTSKASKLSAARFHSLPWPSGSRPQVHFCTSKAVTFVPVKQVNLVHLAVPLVAVALEVAS